MLVAQSCPTLCDPMDCSPPGSSVHEIFQASILESLWPHGLQPTRLLCPCDFPGKDTGVGCHFLLQGIFPTQGSNPGLLYCRQILYQLSYKGSPLCKLTVKYYVSFCYRTNNIVLHICLSNSGLSKIRKGRTKIHLYCVLLWLYDSLYKNSLIFM